MFNFNPILPVKYAGLDSFCPVGAEVSLSFTLNTLFACGQYMAVKRPVNRHVSSTFLNQSKHFLFLRFNSEICI